LVWSLGRGSVIIGGKKDALLETSLFLAGRIWDSLVIFGWLG
jgi:hypothetical protein